MTPEVFFVSLETLDTTSTNHLLELLELERLREFKRYLRVHLLSLDIWEVPEGSTPTERSTVYRRKSR